MNSSALIGGEWGVLNWDFQGIKAHGVSLDAGLWATVL
jgi:hypothetical protein